MTELITLLENLEIFPKSQVLSYFYTISGNC